MAEDDGIAVRERAPQPRQAPVAGPASCTTPRRMPSAEDGSLGQTCRRRRRRRCRAPRRPVARAPRSRRGRRDRRSRRHGPRDRRRQPLECPSGRRRVPRGRWVSPMRASITGALRGAACGGAEPRHLALQDAHAGRVWPWGPSAPSPSCPSCPRRSSGRRRRAGCGCSAGRGGRRPTGWRPAACCEDSANFARDLRAALDDAAGLGEPDTPLVILRRRGSRTAEAVGVDVVVQAPVAGLDPGGAAELLHPPAEVRHVEQLGGEDPAAGALLASARSSGHEPGAVTGGLAAVVGLVPRGEVVTHGYSSRKRTNAVTNWSTVGRTRRRRGLATSVRR